jgi:hypothetical protein
VRCGMDTSHKFTPGQKFKFWEERGVRLRIEIGCYTPRIAAHLRLWHIAGTAAVRMRLQTCARMSVTCVEEQVPGCEGVVWRGVVWCGVALCGVAWRCVVWRVWCGVAWRAGRTLQLCISARLRLVFVRRARPHHTTLLRGRTGGVLTAEPLRRDL